MIQIGVFFSLLVSIVLVIKDVTKPAFSVLGYEDSVDQYLPMTVTPTAKPVEGAILVMIIVRTTVTTRGQAGGTATPRAPARHRVRSLRVRPLLGQSLRVRPLLGQSQEPLYFANSAMLKDRLRRVEMFGALGVHPGEDLIDRPFRTVVLDCERMTSIDARFADGYLYIQHPPQGN